MCCAEMVRVTHIRVSSADRSFASAQIQGLSKQSQVAEVLLWRGTKRWAVIDEGSDFLGCNLVVTAVRKDLFNTALCP
jgi:hypothetical protein